MYKHCNHHIEFKLSDGCACVCKDRFEGKSLSVRRGILISRPSRKLPFLQGGRTQGRVRNEEGWISTIPQEFRALAERV
jgi:hypothetical protein